MKKPRKASILTNVIALAFHVLVIIFSFIGPIDTEYAFLFFIPLYVLCGYFLGIAKKVSIWSGISVSIFIIIAAISIVSISGLEENSLGYAIFFISPFTTPCVEIINMGPAFFEVFGYILLFASPIVPSLLLYFGMFLRKRLRQKKPL